MRRPPSFDNNREERKARQAKETNARSAKRAKPDFPGECSERVTLGLSRVDLDGDTVRVTGKGGKVRLVPLIAPIHRAIADYLDDSSVGNNAVLIVWSNPDYTG